MNKIQVLLDAMKHGDELPNAPAWKIAGIVAMTLVGLLNASGLAVPVTVDQVVTIIGVAFSIYTQVATTRRLGVRSNGE